MGVGKKRKAELAPCACLSVCVPVRAYVCVRVCGGGAFHVAVIDVCTHADKHHTGDCVWLMMALAAARCVCMRVCAYVCISRSESIPCSLAHRAVLCGAIPFTSDICMHVSAFVFRLRLAVPPPLRIATNRDSVCLHVCPSSQHARARTLCRPFIAQRLFFRFAPVPSGARKHA